MTSHGASSSGVPVPFALGYFLRRRGAHLCDWPHLEYCGMDRAPFYPAPEQLNVWRARGDGIADLWEEYGLATDTGSVNSDYATAWRFAHEFSSLGVSFDIVFAEVRVIPEGLDRYPHGDLWREGLVRSLSNTRPVHVAARRLEATSLCGYDICHPVPSFHSALAEPGLGSVNPRIAEDLNACGLFDSQARATEVLDTANSMDYGTLPFCILAVWQSAVPPAG